MAAKLPKKTILVVEDEGIIGLQIQTLLSQQGYICHLATAADQAFELAAQEKPDLLIMDVYIRGMVNGINVAKKISTQSGKLPVLFVSGTAGRAVVVKKEMQRSAYLKKPFDQHELLHQVKILLKAK